MQLCNSPVWFFFTYGGFTIFYWLPDNWLTSFCRQNSICKTWKLRPHLATIFICFQRKSILKYIHVFVEHERSGLTLQHAVRMYLEHEHSYLFVHLIVLTVIQKYGRAEELSLRLNQQEIWILVKWGLSLWHALNAFVNWTQNRKY